MDKLTGKILWYLEKHKEKFHPANRILLERMRTKIEPTEEEQKRAIETFNGSCFDRAFWSIVPALLLEKEFSGVRILFESVYGRASNAIADLESDYFSFRDGVKKDLFGEEINIG